MKTQRKQPPRKQPPRKAKFPVESVPIKRKQKIKPRIVSTYSSSSNPSQLRTKYDCGFHVLLYVRGFEQKQLSDIDEEKVAVFRKELFHYLLYHSENRKNPEHGSVDEDITDVTDEDEECELIGTPNADSFVGERTAVTPRAEALLSHHSDPLDESAEGTCQGANVDESTEGTDQEESNVDENSSETLPEEGRAGKTKPKARADKTKAARAAKQKAARAAKQKAASNDSSGKTPTIKGCKRRIAPIDKIKFEEHSFLSCDSCDEIYEFIRGQDYNIEVFAVGDTSITAGELLKFLEEGDNDPRIINAFIQCLKYDDKKLGYSEQRIITPTHDLNDKKIVDVIKKELQEVNMNEEDRQLRFLLCHTIHKEECIVLFVDMLAKDQVTICHSSNTGLSHSDFQSIGKAFGKHVREAFGACTPISDIDTPRITSVSFHAKRKDSALGSICCLEQYNGHACPNTLKTHAEGYRAVKLAHLLIHQENSVQQFPEVTAIVDQDNKRKTKKQQCRVNQKKKLKS